MEEKAKKKGLKGGDNSKTPEELPWGKELRETKRPSLLKNFLSDEKKDIGEKKKIRGG